MGVSEEWRPVSGFEGFYEVSSLGRIKSLKRIDCRGQPRPERIMILDLSASGGYPRCRLSRNRAAVFLLVHRVVAEAFIPRIRGMDIVHHRDNNKLNPAAENLEWSTLSKNTLYAYRDGKLNRDGSNNGGSVLTEKCVRRIRALLSAGRRGRDIAVEFKISKSVISNIKNGKSWTHV